MSSQNLVCELLPLRILTTEQKAEVDFKILSEKSNM